MAFWFASLPMPRMEMTVLKPSFLATVTPGSVEAKSTNERMLRASRSSGVATETAWDSSCKFSARFSAVTMTSTSPGRATSLGSVWAAAGAPAQTNGKTTAKEKRCPGKRMARSPELGGQAVGAPIAPPTRRGFVELALNLIIAESELHCEPESIRRYTGGMPTWRSCR